MSDKKLYLIATPIGNLKDISQRALETLNFVDFIAAEDTRHTLNLLNHFNIKKPMVSYYEHNKRERGTIIVDRILNGENCGLVTDAGTPAISDPGEDLVKLCEENSIDVVPIPGPCAFVQALIVSGLPTGRFSFEGFLSMNKTARREHLNQIKEFDYTLIFYEAPHKLKSTLKDLYSALGNRKIALVRELTKVYEEVKRTTLLDAIDYYEDTVPKGEFVLVVEGFVKSDEEIAVTDDAIIQKVNELMSKGIDKKTATKETALFFDIPKRDVYNLLLDQK